MIFAAGLGTRLQPITDARPKALIEIQGKALLQIVIERLKKFGFDEIILNVHHFAELVENFIIKNRSFDIHIEVSDERDLLLDTGGGLKKVAWFFDDGKPFLVHNVDILTNLDLTALYQFHLSQKPLATLACAERNGNRFFLFDKQNELCGWKNFATNETRMSKPEITDSIPLAFSGIHVIDPKIFSLIHQQGKFSMVDVYLELARQHKIVAFKHDGNHWIDVGKKENLNVDLDLIYQAI